MPALLHGATNSTAEEIPPLRPPQAEIPPTVWEEHRTAFIISGVALLLVIGAAVWFFSRARPKIIEPPEVQARKALEPLRGKAEDGALLSKVSQIVRHYVAGAFGLPPGELTTTEFCALISRNPSIGEILSAEISTFLKNCDERKFAPSSEEAPFEAVSRALNFVDQGEDRRAELRQAEKAAEATR